MTYSYQVPVSYTVNISLTATPTGLAGYNTNSIAIFSNETGNFTGNYLAALTPDTVKAAYGSDSLTYKMAQALFTPAPNFRTGGGNLYIFKFDGTNATAGSTTTAKIKTNLSAISAVTDGSLKVTIGSTSTLITGLDFSAIETSQDVADVILAKNPDFYVTEDDDKLTFTAKIPGEDLTITTQSSAVGTDIAGSSFLNIANATTESATDVSGTTLSDAVSAALQQVYFGGVLTTQYQDDAALAANASAIQSMDCVYFNELQSLTDISDIGAANKLAGNSKTRLLAYSLNAVDAKRAVATYATIAQSVNFDASNTANTLNLKTLTGVLPDSGLSDNYVLAANTNGVDIYGNTGGIACVFSNDNNGYTDDVVNQLWLKKDLEVAGFNYLRQTNTKIPQTEEGMTGLKNAYGLVCEQAIKNGVVAAGTWNTAIPFGDPEDFKRNIEEKGYYIYSLPISQQSQVDREARKAPVIQIALKFSGALHFSEVIVTIER